MARHNNYNHYCDICDRVTPRVVENARGRGRPKKGASPPKEIHRCTVCNNSYTLDIKHIGET